MSRILVGSTIPAFKMTDEGYWDRWLINAEAITVAAREAGHEVEWLAVLQLDARGDEPFQPLIERLRGLLRFTPTEAWRFSLDTNEDSVSTSSRLVAICMGRNLIIEYANRHGHDWIYFADADIEAPDDVLVRLLEVGHPVVGANCPTYCLDGPRAASWPMDVRQHWTTAGSLLVAREAFLRVPWRWDKEAGKTDDPATQSEMERLGWPTLVRHDMECTHWPQAIGPLEERPGHDLRVYR